MKRGDNTVKKHLDTFIGRGGIHQLLDITSINLELDKHKSSNYVFNFSYDNYKYGVAFAVNGYYELYEKHKINIVALFKHRIQARAFINNCIPKGTRDKFVIVNIDDVITKEK